MSTGRFAWVAITMVAASCYAGCDGKVSDDAGATPAADAGTTGNVAFDWSPRAPLPIPRTEHGAAVVDGKIYAIGGYSGSLLSRVDVYDPISNA